LAAWTSLPGRTALAAVRGGRIEDLGVVRPCSGASRIGPLYAAAPGGGHRPRPAARRARPRRGGGRGRARREPGGGGGGHRPGADPVLRDRPHVHGPGAGGRAGRAVRRHEPRTGL
ncbi:LOW QUALITY PROTEIN: conserved hypothetical protein, partial [Streptomyces sp. C]